MKAFAGYALVVALVGLAAVVTVAPLAWGEGVPERTFLLTETQIFHIYKAGMDAGEKGVLDSLSNVACIVKPL